MSLRVAVVGGGPGGLFFASQLKRRDKDAEVVVIERNQAGDVFGFGVVFSDATLNQIYAADPVVREALANDGTHWDRIEVRLKGERRFFAGNGMAAIHRRTLLAALQERAREAGVEMRFGVSVDPDVVNSLRDEFDVVVGADGANSVVRATMGEDRLGHIAETASAKFIWFGTRHIFDGLTFVHCRGAHGNFAAHAYPISPDLSTFIVETDENTWRAAGLNEFDVTQPPGRSDEKTREYLATLFANDIDHAEIVANNSRWANFRTRRTERWHADNVVLLGDAVHTAHFSVGSGTKMAMEDGIALARELTVGHATLGEAFAAYESDRHPGVARIQDAARGGLSWWEHFARYYQAFDPTQFGFHFFSRSINIDRIEPRDPQLVKDVRDEWEAAHGAPALLSPLAATGVSLSQRLLSWDGSALSDGTNTVPVAAVIDATGGPSALGDVPTEGLAVVTGGDALDRILISEELRLVRGVPTVLVADAGERLDPETLVLAGRADAVAVR
jgi:salicyloyl-CoA 5-hydroxylase